jgi:hypothetical protein
MLKYDIGASYYMISLVTEVGKRGGTYILLSIWTYRRDECDRSGGLLVSMSLRQQ